MFSGYIFLSNSFRKAFVAFGGNVVSSVGKPKQTIIAALRELESDSLEISKLSNFYSTPAFPLGSGPDFVNAVAYIQTDKNAEELLIKFHKVESIFDRTRFYRWLISYGVHLTGIKPEEGRDNGGRWFRIIPKVEVEIQQNLDL